MPSNNSAQQRCSTIRILLFAGISVRDRRIGRRMLEALGLAGMDALIDKTVPASIRMSRPLEIGEAHSEYAVLRQMRELASRNMIFRSFIGMGYHDCITPRGNPAQYSGKSRLVYAVHALSGGNFAGTSGSAPEFPDDDRGSDRIGNCKRIASG